MTKKLMSWVLDKLSDNAMNLKQVEAYQGQFEDPEDVSVFSPAAFVVINRFANPLDMPMRNLEFNVSVYLCTTHIHGTSTDTMLDLIDSVITALHNQPVRYETDKTPSVPPDAYFGRCFLDSGEFVGILPGLCVYRLSFNVKE